MINILERKSSLTSLNIHKSAAQDAFELSASTSIASSLADCQTDNEDNCSRTSMLQDDMSCDQQDRSRNNNATVECFTSTPMKSTVATVIDLTSVDDSITFVLSMSAEEFQSTYNTVTSSAVEASMEQVIIKTYC